uniref:AAA+ ATPase domain-containing protein n=1 Tax=Cucumis melo TaxID=3656 RepID=A0A9I9DTQ0_CUCME
MYARRIKCRNQRWDLVFRPSKYLSRPDGLDGGYYQYLNCKSFSRSRFIRDNSITRHLLASLGARGGYLTCQANLDRTSISFLRSSQVRKYSSDGDGRNASEGKCIPVKDAANFEKGKAREEVIREDVKHTDSHAELGVQDQKEWLKNEKLAMESRKRESPFVTRRERFKNEFIRRIVPWEKISVSWDTFPYYVNEQSKNLLVECAASHLKHKKFTSLYGARLTSSSGRILLQSIPGTELYRERFVRALARDLKVPLLVLDSSVLAPYDFGDDLASDGESDDEAESGEDCVSDSEDENENSATNEDWTSSGESKSDCSESDEADAEATAEAALKKLIPCNLEEFVKSVNGESDSSSESSSQSEPSETSVKSNRPLRKGDRVKYVGPSINDEADKRITLGKISTSEGPKSAYTIIRGRPLSNGQRGEVYEVDGDRVAVILDVNDVKPDGDKEEKSSESPPKPPIHWIQAKHIEHDLDTQSEDCVLAMEVLSEVVNSMQPIIVYFPDSSQWLSRVVPKANCRKYVQKIEEIFDKISGPVVLICGQNKIESGSKEKEKFVSTVTMILPNVARIAKLPLSLKRLTEGLKATKKSEDSEIYKLFTNVLCLHPPKEEEVLRAFSKQLEEDRRIVISRSNLNELHKIMSDILIIADAEKVVGWAKNHYLSSCLLPSIKGDRLQLPRESLEIAIARLKDQETTSRKPSQSLKNLAKDEYESNFISAVVPSGEIGVKFENIGALEDVKKALNELVILPMRRPELFSRGNLLRPCKGILLFGPPGTGKTLLAKALATEAGANFISITGSTLTSKWFGDAEKLTKSLFSFASKLAPVIIFVDEVDSLLGARGGAFEHEATRRMRNEFMAAWDGLRTKDSQRILILGATNRPFDLDDAVIRRLPRRIYVDLPDAANRMKILKIFLAQENVVPDFQFDELANATEGYSGSDLKNLCIAAAYRPVQELLEEESQGGQKQRDSATSLRPLNLDDFIQSKAKVGPSVAFDATSMNELRKWNEQYGEGGSRKKSPFGFGD